MQITLQQKRVVLLFFVFLHFNCQIKMKNKLFYGDNLEVLRKYVKTESVDLCYIDPPFNSNRNYNQIYNNIGKEDTASARAFVDTWTWGQMANEGFDDIINNKTGIQTQQSINLILGMEKILGKGSLLAYIVSMTQRIAEIHRVLKKTGSFYLHCDPTASHYLKLVCDAIFCPKGGELRNELIWHYEKWTAPTKYQFQKNHDVVFFYAKSPDTKINVIKEITDNLVKKYKNGYLIGGGNGSKGLVVYDANNPKAKELIDSGKYEVVYANKEGKPISDVWKIPFINPMAKERLGYPTQKPEALLEKVIKASSNEGEVVLDAYCGCGTTVAVAERLKRNWIGIDITYQSIALILKRLEDTFGGDFTKDLADKETKQIIRPASVELNGVPQDFASAVALANKQDDRLRKEFEKWFVLAYSNNRAVINEKKGGDGGIDGIAYMMDRGEKEEQTYKQVVFQVKSGQKLTPDVIDSLAGVLEKQKAAIGYLLTLYPMPNLVKAAAKYGTYQNKLFNLSYPKIVVVSVQELLDGARMAIPAVVSVLKSAESKLKEEKNLKLSL